MARAYPGNVHVGKSLRALSQEREKRQTEALLSEMPYGLLHLEFCLMWEFPLLI